MLLDPGSRRQSLETDKEQRASNARSQKGKEITTEKNKVFALLATCDAVLVLNYEKNGVAGYIGAGVLMEMAVAHSLGKPIFILFPLPGSQQQRWEPHAAHVRIHWKPLGHEPD